MKTTTFSIRLCAFIGMLMISMSAVSQTCDTTVNTYPYNESFESSASIGTSGWTQDTRDDFNWTRTNNRTPSNGTGPEVAADGNFYLFIEASSPRSTGDVANLESPCFNLSGVINPEFTFSYHMFGSNTGTLNVDVSTDNGATYLPVNNIFSISGQQQGMATDAYTLSPVIDLSSYIGQTIKIRFSAVRGNGFRSDIAIDNVSLTATPASPVQEINIASGGNNIADGDTTPDLADNTNFGNVDTAVGTVSRTFTIQNFGSSNTLTLDGTPLVDITGPDAGDFSVTINPANSIPALGSTTFEITFDPSSDGPKDASVSIDNNDADEDPYNFSIQGTGISTCSSMVITLPYNEDFETGTNGWNPGGADANRINDPSRAYLNDHSLQIRSNSGDASAFCSPLMDLSPFDKVDFKFFFTAINVEQDELFHIEYSPDGGSTWLIVNTYEAGDVEGASAVRGDFDINNNVIFYSKTATLLSRDYTLGVNSRFRVRAEMSDNTDLVYIDNISINGVVYATPTIGPGGVTNDLGLWLQADKLDGTAVGTDGALVNSWIDTGQGNDAKTVTTGQEPTYRNSVARNINFNPVVDFTNDNNTAGSDMTYLDNRQVLQSTAGFHSNDIFMVIIPDTPVSSAIFPLDTFTSTDPTGDTFSEDVTGFGYGAYSQRFTNEVFAYAIGTSNAAGNGFGRASTNGALNLNQISIINTRHNTTNDDVQIALNATLFGDVTSDAADFSTISDTRYWIGRSQYFQGSFDGRIAEIITYSNRKNDTDLTQERNRIQSYLGIKYGITLGANGTSQDYVDSSGNVIWDQSANVGFNFDIAGIGRDDASGLDQRQSSSVNTEPDGIGETRGIISMGLTQLYDTNSENISNNSTTFTDGQFLTWGNNGLDLDNAPNTINVDMSAGIAGLSTPVSFIGMQRVWKVVENGGDIPSVQVSIPENAVRNIAPPGSFLMFISDTGVFDPTADYRVMRSDGSGNLLTEYDFDGTKFITFGFAPQVVVERSVFFDGIRDYVDVEDNLDLNTSEYTMSAWVKRANSSSSGSIMSKRNAAFSEGYDFNITSTGNVEFSINGGAETITSATVIPDNVWHHIAVIYNGSTATLYIDGVPDSAGTGAMSAPVNNNQSFIIAAADGFDPNTTNFFEGNIDEVRVWDVALTEGQLRYIMNQEIEDNAGFVNGDVLPATITNNEVASMPWTDLAGYFPMTIFTYTNVNDLSSNNLQGALRNLDTVDFQTAPLPYETSGSSTDWDANVAWINGNELTIPGAASIANPTRAVDWNIVRVNHNMDMDNFFIPEGSNNFARSLLGMTVAPAVELTLLGDTSTNQGQGLIVSHYLKLDGTLDLEGESQLIQSLNSDLDVTSAGVLERDQQGTQDLYTYNYWSSPVGVSNTTSNNNDYTYADIYRDGTDPANPIPINFTSAGFNGSLGTPITIADYWIFKFTDFTAGNIAGFQQVRSTGTLQPGEGFTLKGVNDTAGNVSIKQNYVAVGKPHNGEIRVPITAGNNYLVGNPYASALDAEQFILDNGPVIDGASPGISGTLYFWEHFGGGSHILREYQGGYGTFNLSGGTPAASTATSHPDLLTGGVATKTPGPYVPVGQGFFVLGETTGDIVFNNGQRAFVKEDPSETSGRSVFVGIEEKGGETIGSANQNSSSVENENRIGSTNNNFDSRMKIRLGFNSVNTYHRQLLVTVDERASKGFDWGFDGGFNENQTDDMYWLINDEFYNIQAVDLIDSESVLPLGMHVGDDGDNNIALDGLENVPDNLDIFLLDNELNVRHNLREDGNYEFFLVAGEHLDRFELVFEVTAANEDGNGDGEGEGEDDDLAPEDIIQNLTVFYSNDTDNIIIINPEFKNISSVEMINIIGQNIFTSDNVPNDSRIEYPMRKLVQGTYIIRLTSDEGIVTKKVLVD